MTSCSVHVVVFFLISSVINVGSATTLSQTAPSYVPVCHGDTVIFTCTTTTGELYWTLNKITLFSFSSSSDIGNTGLLHPFTLTLTNKSGPSNQSLVSTASIVNVNYDFNATTIYCSNDGLYNFDDMSTLLVADTTLPPIGLSVTALSDSSVNLTWSPPSLDSICITGYIISRDDIPVTTTSTNTLVLSHDLFYGNTYNFTVAAVDKTNTTGYHSQHVIINLSVPNEVRNLNYTSTGDGTITVYWNSPVNSYHPDTTHYIVYTNISNMTDTSHDITSDITNYTLSGVSTGSTYFISVSTVNIIGVGTNNTIYVSIVAVSPTASSSVYTTISSILIVDSTSTSISSYGVTIFKTIVSTSSASTPSTGTAISTFDTTYKSSVMANIHVTPISCVCDSCSTAISVGIGIPISILLSSIVSGVITGCIVYFIMRSRRGSTDVKGQHNPVPMYDVPDVQCDIELQTNTAYGHVN